MSDNFNVQIFFGNNIPPERLVMNRNELNYFLRAFEQCKIEMMSEPFLFIDTKFDSYHGFDMIHVVRYTVEPRYNELEEYYDANTKDGDPQWN